jgi:DNA processing protein
MTMSLAGAERHARLRLARTDGVGPATFARLLDRFGSARAALEAWPDLDGGRARPLAPEAAIAEELAAAQALGAVHIFVGEADYPPLLAQLAEPPPVLLARGSPAFARRDTVALVGARNASAAGRALAAELAAGLGAAGFVVVSGLARGIDTAAHEGALAGGTIACIAGGPDIAYPPENAALQARIAAQGLLLAELPPGAVPQARHFPRRNRVIAGLALGVIVIEAASGSGSLITARLAGEMGREVMAVPGHPKDPRASGGNGLLKLGATLIESAEDAIAALRPFAPAPRPARAGRRAAAVETEAGDPRERLMELLSQVPTSADELARHSGLPAGAVAALLVDLELEGRISRHAGGRVALA